eukprot:superscaffoldBa00006500_g21599
MRCILLLLVLVLVLVLVQDAASNQITERIQYNCKKVYPARSCGDGWYRIDVYRCAKYFWTPRTFRDADNDCRRLKGHLVSMHNVGEYSHVLCLAFRANKRKDHFWIGARSKYLASNISKDPIHPTHSLLPSGKRYKAIKARTNRLKNSVFHRAVASVTLHPP